MIRGLFVFVALLLCLLSGEVAKRTSAQETPPAKVAALPKFVPPQINETLSAEESLIETEIEEILKNYDTDLDALYPLLTHENAKVREEAINRLGFMQEKVELQVQPIAERLSDPNVDVASLAAYLLQPMGPRAVAALPALIWAIEQEDERYESAFSTIGALGAAGAPAVPRLIQFASAKPENAPEIVREKQYSAIKALGEIGPAAAAAKQILKTELQDWGHSETAGIALGKIGAEELLLAEFNQAEEPKRGAVVGLGYLAKPSPAVLQNLAKYIAANSDDEYDRAAAYETAGRLRPTTPEILTLLGHGTKDSEETVRQSAVRAIGEIEPALPEAIPFLLAALADEQETVCQYAASALGSLKVAPEVRLDALLKAGSEGNYWMRRSVEYALSNSTEEFWPLIWKRAQESSPAAALRAYTILSLRLFYEHKKEFDPFVTALLEDQKEPDIVRIAAACIVWYGHQTDREVVALLKRGLVQDESESVLELSLSHLADNRNPESVPLFVELLQKRSKAKARTNEIYDALKEMGPKAVAAVPELLVQLKVPNSIVQYQIASTLGSIGPGAIDAFDPLLELIRNSDDKDSSLRENAKRALEAIAPDDPRLAEAIRAELRDEDSLRDYLREHESETGSLLFNMLKSKQADERILSIEMLSELYLKGTRAAMQAALDDSDPKVQQAAAVALAQLGESNKKELDLLLAAFLAADVEEMDWKLRGALQATVSESCPRLLALLADSNVPLEKRRQAFKFLCDSSYSVRHLQGELEKSLDGPAADQQQAAAILLVLMNIKIPKITPLLKAALDADPASSCIPRSEVFRAISVIAERDSRPLSTRIADELLQQICEGDMELANSYTYQLRAAKLDEKQAERLIQLLKNEERRRLAYSALAYASYAAPEKVVGAMIKRLADVEEDQQYYVVDVIKRQGDASLPTLLTLATDSTQPLLTRELTLRALAEMNDLSVSDGRKLVPLLKDENATLRQWAAVVLAKISTKAEPLLLHLTAALAAKDRNLASQASYNGFAKLAAKGAPAVPEIAKLIENEDENVSSTAIQTLGYIGPAAAAGVPALIAALEQEEDEYARDNIAAALRQIGKPAEGQLVAALQKSEGKARLALLPVFVRFRIEAVVPELQKSLASEDLAEKQAAAVALSCLPQADDACLKVLMEMAQVEDEDKQQARKGIEGLRRMGERATEALPVLQKKLADPDLRYETLRALGSMKAAAEPAVADIADLLEHPQFQSEAATALGEIGSPAAAEFLIAEFDHAPRLWSLAHALAKIKPSPAEKVLPKLFEDLKDPHRRMAALQVIQVFGPDAKTAIPLLINGLKTENKEQRSQYISTLAMVGKGSPAVADVLLPLLEDESQDTRRSAIYALGTVGAVPEKCVPVLLKELASGDKAELSTVIHALGGFHAEAAAAVPVLLKEHYSNQELKATVIDVLGEIGPVAAETSVPLLVELLNSEESPGRHQAIECLGKFGPAAKDALPALESLTKNANLEIQYPALRACWKIAPDRAKELGLYHPREQEEYGEDYDEDY